MSAIHDRIEALAGAIALGEATSEERAMYREHIATCRACLEELGGERGIERVATTVENARESEVWEPNTGDVVEKGLRRRSRALRFGASTLAIAGALTIGVRVLVISGIAHLTPTLADPVVINAGTARIVLEQNSPVQSKPAPAPRRLVVEHNVVQIARGPVTPAPSRPVARPKTQYKPQQIAEVTVHPDVPPAMVVQPNVPVWRRGDASWRTVARTTTTALVETATQGMTHSAESIQMSGAPVTRDAMPIGGATAINPQPPMIAYDEGANGTTAFEVLIDERGYATKCVITKSAGYAVLDATVCKAAMQAHYTPKTVDGRAVQGVYRDAFTFRVQDNQDIEGIPKQIQQIRF